MNEGRFKKLEALLITRASLLAQYKTVVAQVTEVGRAMCELQDKQFTLAVAKQAHSKSLEEINKQIQAEVSKL